MPVMIVEIGRTLVDGPRSRTKLMVLDVVGCQVMVNGLQVVTILTGRISGGANQVCGVCLYILRLGDD
jgi:hypothetical protein